MSSQGTLAAIRSIHVLQIRKVRHRQVQYLAQVPSLKEVEPGFESRWFELRAHSN